MTLYSLPSEPFFPFTGEFLSSLHPLSHSFTHSFLSLTRSLLILFGNHREARIYRSVLIADHRFLAFTGFWIYIFFYPVFSSPGLAGNEDLIIREIGLGMKKGCGAGDWDEKLVLRI